MKNQNGDDIVLMGNKVTIPDAEYKFILKENGKRPTLCFFSERLEGSWTPTILRGDVKFLDLSDPAVKQRLTVG